MSGESAYQCPKCNFTWESTDAPLKCWNCGLDDPNKIESRATLQAKIQELEEFIEGLANDHYARLSVLEWMRERKHDARTS